MKGTCPDTAEAGLGFELRFPGGWPRALFPVTQSPVCHMRTKYSHLFVPFFLKNKGFQAREVRENATYLFSVFPRSSTALACLERQGGKKKSWLNIFNLIISSFSQRNTWLSPKMWHLMWKQAVSSRERGVISGESTSFSLFKKYSYFLAVPGLMCCMWYLVP